MKAGGMKQWLRDGNGRRLKWLIVILIVLGAGSAVWARLSRKTEAQASSFAARRGPLDVTVIEGGSIRAVQSQEVKCEVRVGYQGLKILKIVEEGYEVTEEDIRTNKVLVELDSSEIQKQIVQQDISYETAAANLTDCQQNYEIQLNQNLSDLQAAEQKVRFARLDFDKFLGDTVTEPVIAEVGLEKALLAQQSRAHDQLQAVTEPKKLTGNVSGKEKKPAGAAVQPAVLEKKAAGKEGASDNVPATKSEKIRVKESGADEQDTRNADKDDNDNQPMLKAIDFTRFAKLEVLGDGEAKQKLRKFEDDLQVAQKEEGQANVTIEGTRRLFDKGFVTKIDLEKDEIAHENARLKVQTAETARDLFLKYEFIKTAEESLSKHCEAVRELARARKAAISKLAQTEAKLKSAQGQFNIQSRQKQELADQLKKCVITAQKRGLVVYGGARDENYYYGGEERVREGATVRERQSILTIPDMSKMAVHVKIHESYIKKIKKGQKARITVDAMADRILNGEVTNVGVLPDSQNMWMNPDIKVYLTTITIEGSHDWLKPGMSAKVEIMVNHLDDVVFVPLQAVYPLNGKQCCQLAGLGKSEVRAVETGEFNDEFIQIKSGLKEGEKVLLRPADKSAGEEKNSEKPDEKKVSKPAARPPQTK